MITLDFDLLTWLISFIILIILLIIFWKRQRSASYLLCFTAFWIYNMRVVKETIFPIHISNGLVGITTRENFFSSVNLIPLYFGKHNSSYPDIVLRGIFLNILLTIPFGFGISFISKVKQKDIPRLAFAVGFSIEGVQLIISLAIKLPYRIIDINDILLNAVGVLIGFGFFKVFALLYTSLIRKLNIKLKGLPSYLYLVVSGDSTAAFTRKLIPNFNSKQNRRS